MAKGFLHKYKGEFITVTDEDIIKASVELSKNTGLFSEPAATTAFAGMLNYMNANKLEDNSNNVVLLTGSGLKDLQSVQSVISIPDAIEADVNNL